jgi:uncharacterized lipoprotein YddW (UPF0748 family)
MQWSLYLCTSPKSLLMHLYRYLFLPLLLPFIAAAQNPTDTIPKVRYEPKREFRAAWIATVENIDWPTRTGLTGTEQQKQLIDILNSHQKTGLNAVMFQVRPSADAYYAKGTEPWARWLNGKQGQPPVPFYDPLELAIAEAHKRGIELHAWFNPYSATRDGRFNLLSPDHITNLKPEWFFVYAGKKQFDPGLPEVREYIVKVILNVVDNYDIDGVHMDDYFYPYQIAGQKINDAASFAKYGGEFKDISDWRRNNVDQLIKMLADSIHKHNPRLKFGISPFGIWANKSQNVEGSDTRGGDSYYGQYADSRKWIKEGWIDYINPQIYWHFQYRLAAFEKLVDWWSNNTYNHHLYVGQAPYRMAEKSSVAFHNPAELPNQIRYLRDNPRVQGSVFFSSTSLTKNLRGFTDSLKQNFYRYPALPPPMLWLDSVAPNIPRAFSVTKIAARTVQLKWEAPLPARDKEPVYGYVIYRFEGNEKINLDDPKNILRINYNTGNVFNDTTVQPGKTYTYVVSAIDRLKNEGDRTPSIAVMIN